MYVIEINPNFEWFAYLSVPFDSILTSLSVQGNVNLIRIEPDL